MSGINSGVLGPGLRFKSWRQFQNSILEYWIGAPVFRSQLLLSRTDCGIMGPGSCFRKRFSFPWVSSGILVKHLFSAVNSGILGPGTCCQLWDLGLFFWCKRFVLRSWLWRLWNLGPCVGLAVLSRVGSLVSNRIFASAPVLICFDQSFFGISGATCIQSLLGWGTCFQDLGLGHLFWNFGSGCLFQGPALESWLGAFFQVYLSKKQF